MINKVEMYCPVCDRVHDVEIKTRISKMMIKNIEVNYNEKYYKCNNAKKDNEFVPYEWVDQNLLNARNAYRIKMGLLTSQDIIQIRKLYDLSQVDLAKLLGWGEATISRYESKAIQDEAHDSLLQKVRKDPILVAEYLEKNKNSFSKQKYESIQTKIIFNLDESGKEYLRRNIIQAEYIKYKEPSQWNGYKVLDIDKLEEIVSYFAKNISNLYKVKLMKLLWYADALMYKLYDCSMTGLVYCHDDFGALPIAHYEILELENIIVHKEISDYESVQYRILPNHQLKKHCLKETEMKILDEIIKKFRNYNTKEIVEYMHNEVAYLQTINEEIISFEYAKKLKQF